MGEQQETRHPDRTSDLDLQDLWHRRFPEPRRVVWQNGTLVNDYCPDCALCCGPQAESEPFPMALLDRQISARTSEDFYLLDAHTVSLDQRGCKALGQSGCRQPRQLRPVACNLFPVVLVNRELFLYRRCPASVLIPETAWQDMALRIQDWLNAMPPADINRISMTRRPEDLAARYQNLHLSVQGSCSKAG